jgi:hypothetical protein
MLDSALTRGTKFVSSLSHAELREKQLHGGFLATVARHLCLRLLPWRLFLETIAAFRQHSAVS